MSDLEFFAVIVKARIMILQQTLALILVFSTYEALAQLKCENHTLPDGSTCPPGHIDHVRLGNFIFLNNNNI